jgi:hypothetical protein
MKKYDEVLNWTINNYPNPIQSSDNILRYFHDAGLSISETIKAMRFLCKISLSEAKSMVDENPIWTKEARLGEELKNKALSVFNEDLEYKSKQSYFP